MMAGNLIYTGSQFLMLLTVVRLTDVHTVGEYAFALALTAPIFIFSGLKMRHIQVTDADGVNRSGEFISVRLATSLLALIVCVALGWFSKSPQTLFWLIIAVALFKALEAQIDVLYGTMQRLERMDLIARSMSARGVLGAVVFWLALLRSRSVAVAVASLAIMTLAFVFRESRVVQRLGRSPRPEFSGRRLLSLIWLALPLGASVALGSLTTNMPRYFLQPLEGTAALGVYATIAYVLVATSLIGGSASEAVVPRLANLYVAKDFRAFRSLVNKLATFGLLLGLAGTVLSFAIGAKVLALAFGDVYAKATDVLIVLMVAATCQYVSLAAGAAVYAMRLFVIQIPINILGLVTAIATGYTFTVHYGLIGAAWSVVATQTVMGVAYLVLYIRRGLPRLCLTP